MAAKKKTRKRTTTKKVQATENDPPKPPIPPGIIPAPEDDDDDDRGPDGLTMRRRLFVAAITGIARGNASRSASIAGYADSNANSLKSTASRLLTYVDVQHAIAKRLADQLLDPTSVKSAIGVYGRADMSNFLVVEDGKPKVDWAKAAAAGAIGQVKEWTEEGFEHGGEVTVVKRKFKIHDRLRALELLAKINGQLVERKDITSNGETIKGYAMISPDDWDASAKPAEPSKTD